MDADAKYSRVLFVLDRVNWLLALWVVICQQASPVGRPHDAQNVQNTRRACSDATCEFIAIGSKMAKVKEL